MIAASSTEIALTFGAGYRVGPLVKMGSIQGTVSLKLRNESLKPRDGKVSKTQALTNNIIPDKEANHCETSSSSK